MIAPYDGKKPEEDMTFSTIKFGGRP